MAQLDAAWKDLTTDLAFRKEVSTDNFIRSRGLNHRQFKALLTEIEAEYADVYFSQVRWLSRVATLSWF